MAFWRFGRHHGRMRRRFPGAVIIGAICGILMIYSVEFIDKVLKIDDPVGVSSVHGVCGFTGTILTGLFSLPAKDCFMVQGAGLPRSAGIRCGNCRTLGSRHGIHHLQRTRQDPRPPRFQTCGGRRTRHLRTRRVCLPRMQKVFYFHIFINQQLQF